MVKLVLGVCPVFRVPQELEAESVSPDHKVHKDFQEFEALLVLKVVTVLLDQPVLKE